MNNEESLGHILVQLVSLFVLRVLVQIDTPSNCCYFTLLLFRVNIISRYCYFTSLLVFPVFAISGYSTSSRC